MMKEQAPCVYEKVQRQEFNCYFTNNIPEILRAAVSLLRR